jgi:hypothetical protein
MSKFVLCTINCRKSILFTKHPLKFFFFFCKIKFFIKLKEATHRGEVVPDYYINAWNKGLWDNIRVVLRGYDCYCIT